MASGRTNFIGAVEDSWELFSDRSEDYTRGPPIGFGASSTVYRAIYQPKNQPSHPPVPCALKVLDLDSLPQQSLRLLQRETQMMSLSKHPNVLRVRGSWQDGHKIYIALRLMNAGSAADVMRYGWPGGMEEEVVRCILKQALEGLNYLHINGFIHRDIKAANLLIDDDGTVLLGDLGVAAALQDEDHSHEYSSTKNTDRAIVYDPAAAPSRAPHKRLGKRRSFVGTPCWMAPELISGKHYDSSADIWSFGITALELAQGRAPRSRESSSAVLLQTVHEASPTLNREGGVHKYSRAFKELIDSCLIKDPSMRPTAAQLLELPFFKNAKRKRYLVNTILRSLPPLANRLERRRAASLKMHGTVDSWDFNKTVLTESLVRPLGLDDSVGPDNAVFEFDDVFALSRKDEGVPLDPPLPSPPLSVISSSSIPSLSPFDGSAGESLESAPEPATPDRKQRTLSSYERSRPSIASYPSTANAPIFSASPPASASLWTKLKASSAGKGDTIRKSSLGSVLKRPKTKS